MELLLLVTSLLLVQASSHGTERVAKAESTGVDPRGFVFLGGRQYYFPPSITVTAIEAISVCNDLGMGLASLETEQENLLVKNHIVAQETTNGYWTSGNRYHDQWIWSGSGQLFSYVDWDFNEPSEMGLTDACVMLHGNTAWSDARCDARALYICEQMG